MPGRGNTSREDARADGGDARAPPPDTSTTMYGLKSEISRKGAEIALAAPGTPLRENARLSVTPSGTRLHDRGFVGRPRPGNQLAT